MMTMSTEEVVDKTSRKEKKASKEEEERE